MLLPLFFVCLCSVLSYATETELPGGIVKCKNDNTLNDCIMKQSKDVLTTLSKGDPKHGIPPIDPMHIEKLQLTENGKKAVSLNLTLENIYIFGYSKSEIIKIDFDTSKNHIKLKFKVPNYKLVGKYKVNGKFLVVPVTGDGKLTVLVDDLVCEITITFHIEEKEGKAYLVINPNPQITYTVKKAYFNLENLFNGNKALGDATNKMINENWPELLDKVGPAVAQALVKTLGVIVSNLAKNIPMNELFKS